MDFAVFLPLVDAGQRHDRTSQLRENAAVRHLWIQAARESRRPVAGATIMPLLPLALPAAEPHRRPRVLSQPVPRKICASAIAAVEVSRDQRDPIMECLCKSGADLLQVAFQIQTPEMSPKR
jgi:hypothetical protein